MFIDSKTVNEQKSSNKQSYEYIMLKIFVSAGKTVSELKEQGPDENQLEEVYSSHLTQLFSKVG